MIVGDLGIDISGDHIVPTLEPDEACDFIALLGIVVRVNPFDVAGNVLDVFDHQSVVATGGRLEFLLLLFGIVSFSFDVIRGGNVWSRTGRAKIRVK